MTWRFALSTLFFFAAASPALAQEIDCLFLSPVPVEELPPGFIGADEVCLERERFEFDGRQFIFADIVGYDRSYADRQFALTREVIERSLPLYRTWFEIPDALFLFGRAPGAAAQAETGGAREACVVRVDDVALRQGIAGDSDDDQFRRAMAHELFHCVQTFDPQIDNEYVRWRDEGTAEYFAGLAIPESLPGPQLYADFDALIGDTPLYDLGFHAYPFFAFLGGDGGVGAVVDFLRAGRANPDEAGTLTHLSSYPGMDDLFHRFARRWAEGRLLDDQGRPLPLGGFSGDRLLVERETTIEADLKPFTIFTQALSLSSGLAWNFPAPDYSGRASLAEAPGAWRDLEASVDSCRAERDVTLLATSSANSREAETVTFTIAERPDLARDCPCPIGSWILAGDALAATGFGSTGTGTFESGSLVLKFDDGGQATAIFNDITYFTDGAVKLRTILGGQLHWTWRMLPFAAAKLGPAPSGTGLEALAIERSLTTADAHWRVQFINDEGAVVGEKATEVKPDQWGGGKNLVGAVCQGGELLLADDAASLVPGNIGAPPYSGAYQRW